MSVIPAELVLSGQFFRHQFTGEHCVNRTKIGLKSAFVKFIFLTAAYLVAICPAGNVVGQSAPTPAERIDRDIKWLASDELEGREPGSAGIESAAEFIVKEFKTFGVESGTPDGTFRQPFEINMGVDVSADETRLEFRSENSEGPELTFAIGEDFRPLMLGGGGKAEEAGLVFVGYGISDEDNNYDEYKDIDVNGKVVVLIRMEPQQKDENSVFDGTENSANASISRKLELAKSNGAVAVIMVNDGVRAADDDSDEIAEIRQFGPAGADIPFFHLKRSAFTKLLADSPIVTPTGEKLATLPELEALIDEKLEPLSQVIEGWKVNASVGFSANMVTTSNIIGVVEGEGPHADETIVIGGHYDHLGYGGYGSNAPGRNEIHNGADDNATGTAGIIELARRFAQSTEKPSRRLVFIAFSGEERGLLGSAYYVDNPLYPLDKTVAMINYDMIGRLRDDKLTIFGTGTSKMFDEAVATANETENPLVLDKQPSPFAGSDHMAFVRHKIPVMFLHTGLTNIYHTPEDDYDTLNIPGAIKVIDYTERLVRVIAEAETKPEYTEFTAQRRSRAYLGIRFDYDKDDRGAAVEELPDGSPAIAAGLEAGDIILSIGGAEISDRTSLTDFLSDKEPGDKVEVKYLRGDKEMTAELELGTTPRRRRNNDN